MKNCSRFALKGSKGSVDFYELDNKENESVEQYSLFRFDYSPNAMKECGFFVEPDKIIYILKGVAEIAVNNESNNYIKSLPRGLPRDLSQWGIQRGAM